jgi:FtsP/CotA-like multicopper oxidase with cupredoxin domain
MPRTICGPSTASRHTSWWTRAWSFTTSIFARAHDKLPCALERGHSCGVFGDVMLVNGAAWPRLDVSNTRYRFHILNASNARHLELALEPGPRFGPAFCQIGSDGGLLERPVMHSRLPIASAERCDVVIDFSQYAVGDNILLRNTHASRRSRERYALRCSPAGGRSQQHSRATVQF